jgi:hypothetical protein
MPKLSWQLKSIPLATNKIRHILQFRHGAKQRTCRFHAQGGIALPLGCEGWFLTNENCMGDPNGAAYI